MQLHPHHDFLTAAGLAFTSIMLPRSRIRNVLFIPAISYFAARPILLRVLSSNPSQDFGIAMIVATYVFQVAAVLLSNLEDLRRHGDGPDKPSDEVNTWTRRLWWAWTAFVNPRFVGWNWQIKSPRPEIAASRCQFLIQQTCYLAITYLVVDLCQAYFHSQDWFTEGAINGVKLLDLPAYAWISHAMVWGIYAYTLWFLPLTFLSLVAVTIGLHQPSDFPPPCGALKDAYTVRRFWGKAWHQEQRSTYKAISRTICETISTEDRPRSLRYITLVTAFSISAIVHAAGSYVLPADSAGKRGFSGAIMFFLAQIPAICLEDITISAFKSRSWRWAKWSNGAVRAMGYLWVVAWGSTVLVLSGWLDEMVSRRTLAHEMFPFSISRGLLTGQWTVS